MNEYFITSCGRVWSYKSNKFLTLDTNKDGYKRIKINGKNYAVHRLVAEKYIPNPNNLPEIDHIDTCRKHNWVSNLQWINRKDNVQKSIGFKVRCIETGETFNSLADASRSVGKNPGAISKAFSRNSNYCGGYHWEMI